MHPPTVQYQGTIHAPWLEAKSFQKGGKGEMKRTMFLLIAGLFLAAQASAQASAGAQTSASGESAASLTKGKGGAQASGSASASADTSARAGKNSDSLGSGTTMQAELSHPLDAGKNKPGDQVVAKTSENVKSDGKVLIPKGSKIVGHVTQVKGRAKGQSESSLGIVFDHAVLKDGREIPFYAVIQSLAAAQSSAAVGGDDLFASGGARGSGGTMAGGSAPSPRGGGGGGLVGGVSSTAGGTVGAVTNTTGGTVDSTVRGAASATSGATGTSATGALSSTSSGVIGMKGLSLNSQATSASQGSLIVSSTRNVHLDSGTRMLLRTEAQYQ